MQNHHSPTHPEPLEIELLVTADQRRPRRHVSVADHARFRETLDDPHRDDGDIEDLLTEIRDPFEVSIKPSRLKR